MRKTTRARPQFAALNTLNRDFRPRARDISAKRVANCSTVEVVVEEMIGRRQTDCQFTMWRYSLKE
jgi:hypothetical protein